MNLLDYLLGVPDFPKPGILFRDISPLLANPNAFQFAIDALHALAMQFDYTHIVGIESRGFIFGSALALHAHKGFVLVRKPNKLPLTTYTETYGLEYGSDALQIQQTILPKTAKVLLIDDVLATGGTLVAASKLVAKTGATLSGAIALAEITALSGQSVLQANHIPFKSLLKL